MPFALLPLPFDPAALAPHMSAETLALHHGKHHQAYVDKTNLLAEELGQDQRSLLELLAADIDGPLLKHAGQLRNHNFFWQCLTPDYRLPEGRLAHLIDTAFGSQAALLDELHQAGMEHFGSGWLWLVLDQGALRVLSLHDGETPVGLEQVAPLLTVDLWEHAYYVDYRNDRAAYLKAVLGNMLDWSFAARNLDGEGLSRADQAAVPLDFPNHARQGGTT